MLQAILQGASLAGGLAGALRKPKTPDIYYMQKHFGEGAVADRAAALAQKIMSSAYGQSLLGQSAESGQALQTAMNERAAQSGFGAAEGAESGASTFATGAASQAAGNLMNQTRANVLQSAIPQAQQAVENERQRYIDQIAEQNARPNAWEKIGQAASMASSLMGGSSKTDDKKTGDGKTDATTTNAAGTTAPAAGTTAPAAATAAVAPAAGGAGKWTRALRGAAGKVGRFFGIGRTR